MKNEIMAREIEERVMEIEISKVGEYIKRRKNSLRKTYAKLAEEDGVSVNGLGGLKLQRYLFSPLMPISRVVKRYSAVELLIVLEYFQEQIEKINEQTLFPPQLEQFCKLLGISTNTFKLSYLGSNDDELRNAAQQVVDYISMSLSYGGMTRQIDNTAQIFVQKSGLGRKDNEQPVVNNNNNTIVITPEEFAKQIESLK